MVPKHHGKGSKDITSIQCTIRKFMHWAKIHQTKALTQLNSTEYYEKKKTGPKSRCDGMEPCYVCILARSSMCISQSVQDQTTHVAAVGSAPVSGCSNAHTHHTPQRNPTSAKERENNRADKWKPGVWVLACFLGKTSEQFRGLPCLVTADGRGCRRLNRRRACLRLDHIHQSRRRERKNIYIKNIYMHTYICFSCLCSYHILFSE